MVSQSLCAKDWALHNQGLAVEADPDVAFTETHQVIVNVGYAKGCEIARHLERSNIIVNYQALPGTAQEAVAGDVLRLR